MKSKFFTHQNPLVKEKLQSLSNSGAKLHEMADFFNNSGYTTKRGKRLSPGTVFVELRRIGSIDTTIDLTAAKVEQLIKELAVLKEQVAALLETQANHSMSGSIINLQTRVIYASKTEAAYSVGTSVFYITKAIANKTPAGGFNWACCDSKGTII